MLSIVVQPVSDFNFQFPKCACKIYRINCMAGIFDDIIKDLLSFKIKCLYTMFCLSLVNEVLSVVFQGRYVNSWTDLIFVSNKSQTTQIHKYYIDFMKLWQELYAWERLQCISLKNKFYKYGSPVTYIKEQIYKVSVLQLFCLYKVKGQ